MGVRHQYYYALYYVHASSEASIIGFRTDRILVRCSETELHTNVIWSLILPQKSLTYICEVASSECKD